MSFEHVKYRNLYHVHFSWQLSVFCNAIFFLRILSQLKLYISLILIQCLTMLELSVLRWKYPDYYYWRTLGWKHLFWNSNQPTNQPTKLRPHECTHFHESTKIEPHENKWFHSTSILPTQLGDDHLILRGGGGWHFVEINILTLKMLKINNLSSSVKKTNNLNLIFLLFGGGLPIFPIYFCYLRSQQLNSQIFFRLTSLAILKQWYSYPTLNTFTYSV